MEPVVSVIIPVYNGEKTIERAVSSVMNQTYQNIEVIIVDDCSIDHTFKIINRLKKKDVRIHCFKNYRNLGVANTRNFASRQARGKYIAFLDSDDEWSPDKLDMQLRYIEETQADLCYTGYYMVDVRHKKAYTMRVPQKVSYTSLLKENSICCSTVLLKRDILRERYFKKEYFHEDFILWLQLLKDHNKVIGIREPLVWYATGGRSSNKKVALKYRWRIYRQCEQLSLGKSIYYLIFYIINGIKKYYLKINFFKTRNTEKRSLNY